VDTDATLKNVEKHFGTISPGAAPPRVKQTEPDQHDLPLRHGASRTRPTSSDRRRSRSLSASVSSSSDTRSAK